MSLKPQSTRRIIRTFLRPWWRRPLALVAGFGLALVGGRIALEPLLTAKVRKDLERVQTAGVVTFRDLDVSLFPPTVVFNDLAFRGRSGAESLDVDRLEIVLPSLRELVAPVPHVGVRMVRPHLRTAPGARDLDRLARALPPARVDVVSVVNGSVSHSAGGDGRPAVEGVSGAIEGVATGTEVGRVAVGWKISADGRMANLNPARMAITFAPTGAWEMALTARASGGAQDPNGHPIDMAALVNGAGSHVKARVHVAWLGTMVPVILARDVVSGLSDKWPTADLVLTEAREDQSSAGQARDLVIEQGAGKEIAKAFGPRDGIGIAVNVIRLSAEVLIPSPPGLATRLIDKPTGRGSNMAANLEDEHDPN